MYNFPLVLKGSAEKICHTVSDRKALFYFGFSYNINYLYISILTAYQFTTPSIRERKMDAVFLSWGSRINQRFPKQ